MTQMSDAVRRESLDDVPVRRLIGGGPAAVSADVLPVAIGRAATIRALGVLAPARESARGSAVVAGVAAETVPALG